MNKKRSKKSFIVSFLPILALLALLGLFNSPPVMADATTTVPDGLTTAEWDDIQSQIAVAQYQFASVEDSWTAPNRAQGWQTTFGISGVQVSPANDDWTWGLALTGYGYGENVVTVDNNPALTADKETITYQWNSNLNEWWINSAAGLAQGFTLQQRPGQTQGQPLQLNMTVRGDLTPVLDSDAILFQNEAGDTILRYDRLYVVDATGQEIPAHLTIDKSQLPLALLLTTRMPPTPSPLTPGCKQPN